MLSFIPLHLSALQRSQTLKDWIKSWLGNQAEFLEPSDWFERGHDMSGGSKLPLDYTKLSSVPSNVVRQMLYFKRGREIPSQGKGTQRARRS
jgi:hypothetical protein